MPVLSILQQLKMSVDSKTLLLALAAGGAGAVAASLLLNKLGGSKSEGKAPSSGDSTLDQKIAQHVNTAVAHIPSGAAKTFPAVGKPAVQRRILVSGGAGFVGSNLVDALMMQVSSPHRPPLPERCLQYGHNINLHSENPSMLLDRAP
jgi:hypothetical protein